MWVYPFVGFMFVLRAFLRENLFSMNKNTQEGGEHGPVCRTLTHLVAGPTTARTRASAGTQLAPSQLVLGITAHS